MRWGSLIDFYGVWGDHMDSGDRWAPFVFSSHFQGRTE